MPELEEIVEIFIDDSTPVGTATGTPDGWTTATSDWIKSPRVQLHSYRLYISEALFDYMEEEFEYPLWSTLSKIGETLIQNHHNFRKERGLLPMSFFYIEGPMDITRFSEGIDQEVLDSLIEAMGGFENYIEEIKQDYLDENGEDWEDNEVSIGDFVVGDKPPKEPPLPEVEWI